jgi:hypothetical protein
MRTETLLLIRVQTQETARYARANKHKTDGNPAWKKLHKLLSDPAVDEFERGMFEKLRQEACQQEAPHRQGKCLA